MSEVVNLSRRQWLQVSALAGGGLVLGVFQPQLAAKDEAKSGQAKLNAFVRIGSDDLVTVVVNHLEMGQGQFTAVPMLVAEELEADWSKVRFEPAPVAVEYNHSVYGMQMTGGSSSSWSEWERVRKAGAAARTMLIEAAAKQWKVEPAACRAELGHVIHKASGKKLSFGKLAEAAAKLEPPKEVALKDAKDLKILGKPLKRLDTPQKVDGSAVFGIDIQVPGMLVAVVARPPVFGGKVKSFDAKQALAVPGVRHVVQIDRGIAVAADGFWQATQGRAKLKIDWDEGPLASLETDEQGKQYAAMAQKPGAVAAKIGDAPATLDKAQKKLTAEYHVPYLAHACMEPMNATAHVTADRCEIWAGTQFQTIDRDNAAKATGLKPEQIELHTTLAGGGFGRRAVLDSHFVVEAIQISQQVKKPVKVIWTREDDTRGGFYRPRASHFLTGAIGDDGLPLAWQQRIVCQSFLAGTSLESVGIKDGIDDGAVEGARTLAYDVPNLQVEWHMAPAGVPTLWWRSVGHSHTAFACESFLDELAHAAGQDPYEYRRTLLAKHPRHLGVLQLAAEKAGWGQPLPKGRGRGLAVHESFGSFVAQVIEASVSKEGEVTVHRVVGACDCGPTVNPDSVKAQMEGAAVYGLTAALYGEITFKKGRVQQGNFDDYLLLSMDEMPTVETYIVPSTEKMGGMGEPGVPPIAPALCNAIFAATGKRIRSLPIRRKELRG
ncbi:MAG: xanthine dehydrogenase family protein molybdopterin-binding subunit [Pirellulales bacterium]